MMMPPLLTCLRHYAAFMRVDIFFFFFFDTPFTHLFMPRATRGESAPAFDVVLLRVLLRVTRYIDITTLYDYAFSSLS